MRKLIVVIVACAVVAGTLSLAVALGAASLAGCPTALLEGTLVEHEGTLAVAGADGTVTAVEWPFGYGVGEDDGTLILTRVFVTVAREGDFVSVGGGEGGPGFRACGPVTSGPVTSGPPVQPDTPAPAAILRVTGTAFEPCIPPPSGCGYWVSVSSPGLGTHRAPLDHRRSADSAANGDPTPLVLVRGLPAALPPGTYELVFEVGEFSDAATMEPLEDGTMGYRPRLSVACTGRLDVPEGAAGVSADVAFRGSRCEVASR